MIAIFLFSSSVLRVDSCGSTAAVCRRLSRDSGVSAADAVISALSGSKSAGVPRVASGSKVVVVTEEAFAQTVSLPLRQCTGLTSSELSSALEFEAEPFSGMNASNSIIAFRRTGSDGGNAVFDVVQIRKDLYAQLRKAVRAGRGTLVGVATMPQSLAEGSEADVLQYAAEIVGDNAFVVNDSVGAALEGISAHRDFIATAAVLLLATCVAATYLCRAQSRRNEEFLQGDFQEAVRLLGENEDLVRKIYSGEVGGASRIRTVVDMDSVERRDWSSVLSTIERAFDGRCVARSMKAQPSGAFLIEAVAASGQAQDACMKDLAKEGAAAGWRVVLISADSSYNGAAPFQIVLTFVGDKGVGK